MKQQQQQQKKTRTTKQEQQKDRGLISRLYKELKTKPEHTENK